MCLSADTSHKGFDISSVRRIFPMLHIKSCLFPSYHKYNDQKFDYESQQCWYFSLYISTDYLQCTKINDHDMFMFCGKNMHVLTP